MNIIRKNILVFTAAIALVLSGILYMYFANKEQNDIRAGFVQGKIAYSKISDYTDGIMLAKKDGTYQIIDINDKIIEKLDADAKDINILYGGYYSYTLADKVYLKRNGKIIKTFDTLFLEEYALYKDENDEDASYITLNAKKLLKDMYYVTISNDDSITTVIYNAKTGKKLYETDNYISLLETPDMENYEYFVVGGKELVRISDFKTIFKETDVSIVGDVNRKDVEEDIVTNSSKYIVISNTSVEEDTIKYGLIDFEGNIVISLSYEDIFFKANNSKYIVAKKDGKYGLINNTDAEQLDFSYDAIEVYDNNVVTVKDHYLGILDNELKVIYDYKLALADQEYSSRVCCGNTNAFSVFEGKDNLIISTYPKSKEENDGQTFSNTILVNKKNEITELKKQTIKYVSDENDIIKNKFLIRENIEDETLSLEIHSSSGDNTANYETIASKNINSVSYELFNEEQLLITIYDKDYNELYKCIINPMNGKVIAESEDIANYIKKQSLVDGYYFYGKNNTITIKDSNDNVIMNLDGKDIIYLKGSYYAVKMLNNKYYICKVILEEQVK